MNMSFLGRWGASMITTLVIIFISPGIVIVSLYHVTMSGVILGLYNAVIPYLISMFSFKRSIVSLGAFSLVGNSFIMYILDRAHVGIRASSFQSIVLAAVSISVITWFITLSMSQPLLANKNK